MTDSPESPTASGSHSQSTGAAEQRLAPTPHFNVELIPASASANQSIKSDEDSGVGIQPENATASITTSILEYRTIQGRTYHSGRYNTEYFTPNDEQQSESVDITHHYLTLLLGGKLFVAPIGDDVEAVLDIGTGTGAWAIDFADEFPNAEVTGTDLSPIQPAWVPANVKFELDDATDEWTWPQNTFDFIHLRYLFGAITDWTALFREAHRCTRPGGWIQSCEIDPCFESDDGTIEGNSAIETWNALFLEGGKKLGNSFSVVKENLQVEAMHEAGFVDIRQVDHKVPVGPWTKDPQIREVGQYLKLTMENDLQGYTLMLWHKLEWPADDYQIFLMNMRKVLRNRHIHGYMFLRYVYGRKPDSDVQMT